MEGGSEWAREAASVRRDYDELRAYFVRNRACGCEIGACPHFRRHLKRALGPRLRRLYYGRLYEGFRAYYDALERAGRR